MANSEVLIPIPGRLHSVATEGHVAGADEIYDDQLAKNQETLNANSAYLGDDDGQAVIPGFDPQTDTLHKAAQVLTTAEKDQVQANILDKSSGDGMGKVILKQNLVNGVNTLTQAMMQTTNTIYVIRYDYTLASDITVPANCVLEFDGGLISGNGANKNTIIGTNTRLIVDDYTQVFANILLSGTFDCNHLSVCNFGVVEDSENDSANTAIINTYIIPSLENTFTKLLVPNGTYYINDSLVFSGNYSIECQGKFIYSDSGVIAKTAITIGDGNNHIGSYKISITRSQINYQQDGNNDYIIPESVGVKIINAKFSEIIIDSSNFAYCTIINSTNNKGFVRNKISVTGGGYCYNALMLSTDNSGWTNENYFSSVELYTFTGNVLNGINIGIHLNGDSSHPINNNVFMKPCYEGFHIGYKVLNASYNSSFSDRMEAVAVPVEVVSNSVGNSFLVGFVASTTGELPLEATRIPKVIEAANRKVIFDGKVSEMILTGSYKTYLPFYFVGFTGSVVYAPVISGSASNKAIGFIVDTSKVKSLRISSNYASRAHIMVLDSDNQKVTLTTENLSTYFKNSGSTYMVDGALRGGTNAYSNQVVVTENTTKIFIGIAYGSTLTDIHLETFDDVDITTAKACIITPIEQKITTVPTSTTNAEIGKVLRYNDDAIMWTGTKWVILNQTPT